MIRAEDFLCLLNKPTGFFALTIHRIGNCQWMRAWWVQKATLQLLSVSQASSFSRGVFVCAYTEKLSIHKFTSAAHKDRPGQRTKDHRPGAKERPIRPRRLFCPLSPLVSWLGPLPSTCLSQSSEETEEVSRREYFYFYFLENNLKVRVCKKMFHNAKQKMKKSLDCEIILIMRMLKI